MPALSPEAAAALLPVLLEGMGGGMALHDAELRRSFASRAMDEMLGLPEQLAAPGTALVDQLAALEAAGLLRPAAAAGVVGAFAGPGRQEFAWQAGDGRHLALTVLDAPAGARLALCRDVTAAHETEQRLAAGRARVEHLLSRTRDVVVLMDPDGIILENSDRTGELLSLPPELARPGATHQDILRHMVARGDFGAVEDPEAFVRERREGILRAGTVTFPSRMQDGAWVEYNFRVMEDGNLLAFVRDITALKTTELALEKERGILATIIENLPDGVMLYDADFRWRLANRQLMEFQALTEEVAYPGARVEDILRFQARRGDFGPPPATPEGLDAMVAERATLMRRPEGSQYVRQTAGGFWIEFNTRPLPDGGLLGFYRDITPLKQREAELEAERTLLREVLDGVDALVLLLDRDANILVANASRRDLMATPDEFYRPGTNLADAVRWRYRQGVYGFETDEEEAVRSRVSNVYSGDVVRYVRRMPDGIWVETIWTPISDGRVVGFYRDITALKEREAELEAERKLLREVLASNDAVVTVFDADAKVLLANGLHEDLLGTPPGMFAPGSDHAAGLRWMIRRGDYGTAVDVESLVRQRMAEIYSGQFSRDVRRMPNGRWLERTYAPLSGGRVISHGRDITELKQHEEELTTERAMLREVLDSSDSVIIVLDREGRVLLANGRFEELIGVPAEMHDPGRAFSEIIRYLYRRGDFGFDQD
ncbi:MAG: multi-sensor hybrid histidine kinase, partial [Rubritepida sp.]|nr:multi-sensor hybrid histidine kinase [Rubritepida sp.]